MMIARRAAALALAGPALACACSHAGSGAPVVVVSVDGLVPGDVLAAGEALPNLHRLVVEGAYARGAQGIVPTITAPGHATLITGAPPARHGVIANDRMEAYQRRSAGGLWLASEIAVPTLFDAARDAGLVTANVGWPLSAGAPITYNVVFAPGGDRHPDDALSRALSTPDLIDELEASVAPFRYTFDLEGDRMRARYAAHLIRTRRPDLTTVYLCSADGAQHGHGPGTPAARAAYLEIDRLLGELLAAAGDGALFFVVSDHGFAPVTHEVRINDALRQAGLLAAGDGGRVTSWRAYAWSGAGSAAIMLADPTDESAREAVKLVLDQLAADPGSGVERIVEGGQGVAASGFPGAAFVVNARRGFVFSTRALGPLVAETPGRGMHGYLPDDPAMDASFFARGPGIPRGHDLGRISILDVAPTIAGRLGIALRASEGRDVFASRGGP